MFYYSYYFLLVHRLNGTSGPCDTFANQCLAHNEEFELKNVEVTPQTSVGLFIGMKRDHQDVLKIM